MYQEIRDTLGTAYERFLMRDLTYVFAGLIIVTSVKYAYDGKIFDLFSIITKGWTNFILFFLSLYFIGCLTKEALSYWNKCDDFYTELKYPHWFSTCPKAEKYYILMFKIQKKFGMSTIRRLERTAYFYHIGASIGTASLVGSLILSFVGSLILSFVGSLILLILLVMTVLVIVSAILPKHNIFFTVILFLSFLFCRWYIILSAILPKHNIFHYIFFTVILFLSFLFCRWYNLRKLDEYNRHLNYLKEG